MTRMLQSDPGLDNVGLVIFDEFHERSLDADLGLVLCLDMQAVLNRDLRLLVMSATIDTGPVADMLDDAPVLTCPPDIGVEGETADADLVMTQSIETFESTFRGIKEPGEAMQDGSFQVSDMAKLAEFGELLGCGEKDLLNISIINSVNTCN